MSRFLAMLVLGAGLAAAQEKDDESGITIDEVPTGPEEEPQRTKPRPARAPGQKPAKVTVRGKAYALDLPEDWVLIEEHETGTELNWEVLLPGSNNRASLALIHDSDGDTRSTPYRYAADLRKGREGARTETFREPLPRTISRFPSGNIEWANEFVFVAKGCRRYVLRLSCAAADLPASECDLLDAAKSLAVDVEPWPPIPKGYEMSLEGGWRIARARAATASIVPLRKALLAAEKRFREVHGALPKCDVPFVLLVHASKTDAAEIEPEAADREHGFHGDVWHRRLFAVPFAKDDAPQRGWLAGEVWRVLLVAKYGDSCPEWFYVGESTVARVEAELGKPLPSLEAGYVRWLSDIKLHRLDELEQLRKTDWSAYSRECLFQVAALRGGKYRAEYKAFLDDYARTSDGLGAVERHLQKIDPEELRAALYDYVHKEIKAEKREERAGPKR